MKALWKVQLYNRYGEVKDVGSIIHVYEEVPAVSRKYKGYLIDGQPCSVSFDVIEKYEGKERK